MKAKKYLAIALTLTMLLVLCVVGANAEADVLPDGAALVDDEHNGFYVKENDYYITSKAGLLYFRDYVNGLTGRDCSTSAFAGKTVYLLDDITMEVEGEPWTPIGYCGDEGTHDNNLIGLTGKCRFAGTFDGNGHTVSNLYFTFMTQRVESTPSGSLAASKMAVLPLRT